MATAPARNAVSMHGPTAVRSIAGSAVGHALAPSPGPSPSPPPLSPPASSAPTSLALLLAQSARFDPLSSLCRTHLSTHLECGQTWYLLSLSLMAAGRYDECFAAVRECLQRHPTDVPALLLAAQLCLDKLERHKESVEYASRALRAVKAQVAAQAKQTLAVPPSASSATAPLPLALLDASSSTTSSATSHSSSFASLSRSPQVLASLLLTAQLTFGQSCSKYAYHVSTFSNRKSLQKRAIHALEQAYQQQQHVATVQAGRSGSGAPAGAPIGVAHRKLLFALACVYADTREIPRALALIQRALSLDRSCGPSWNLLALLLSSEKKHATAVQACRQGRVQVTGGAPLTVPTAEQMESGTVGPTVRACVPLLLTQARLQAHMGQFEEAVATFNELVSVTFLPAAVHSKPLLRAGVAPSSAVASRPVFPVGRSAKDADGTAGGSAAPSTRATGSAAHEWACTRIEVLLALAQLYAAQAAAQAATGTQQGITSAYPSAPLLRDDSLLPDALACASLAAELSPPSLLADVHASLASLSAQCGPAGISHAVRHYERALALDSQHCGALLGLARIEAQRGSGNLVLAYGYLLQALQVDASNHQAWYDMARVLQSQGKPSAAAEHFITALQLERTAPIASFASIRREVA